VHRPRALHRGAHVVHHLAGGELDGEHRAGLRRGPADGLAGEREEGDRPDERGGDALGGELLCAVFTTRATVP
jgi:hypothetical protein